MPKFSVESAARLTGWNFSVFVSCPAASQSPDSHSPRQSPATEQTVPPSSAARAVDPHIPAEAPPSAAPPTPALPTLPTSQTCCPTRESVYSFLLTSWNQLSLCPCAYFRC